MNTRLGILGFAHAHAGMYWAEWRKQPDVRVVAGWDHDDARAATARDKYSVELAESPKALLARKDVDAVVLGAEASVHADLVERAAAASHAIDFIYWLLGKPQSVTAEIDTLWNPKVPDDHGIAVVRYADGRFAEVVSSSTCVPGENTTEIVGEKEVAIQNYGDGPSCNAPRPQGGVGLKWYLHGEPQWIVSEIASPSKHGERISALAKPLVEFLRDDRPPIATREEGREVLRMTLACYESAEEGRRIRLT